MLPDALTPETAAAGTAGVVTAGFVLRMLLRRGLQDWFEYRQDAAEARILQTALDERDRAREHAADADARLNDLTTEAATAKAEAAAARREADELRNEMRRVVEQMYALQAQVAQLQERVISLATENAALRATSQCPGFRHMQQGATPA